MTEPALTPAELDRLTAQRRRLVANRVANVVPLAADLFDVLDSPLHSTIQELLAALATLATLTDPNQSSDWQRSRSPSAQPPLPDLTPAWAAKKLDQIDRQLDELAGNLNGWLHNPHDPHRPDLCARCGRKYARDDVHCRQCGTLLHPRNAREVTRACEQCGTGYVPMRSDSRFCSPRCRLTAHRRRDETDNR